MRRIALLTPTLITADAISNDIHGMHDVLTRKGYHVRIFANENTTDFDVSPITAIKGFLVSPDDILIYHYSMGWNFGPKLLHELKCRRVIKYHNITPPEFFAGISIDYEHVCRAGREQIKDIVGANCDLYLSDSEYNSQDLIAEGADASKCLVVAPFHHIDNLEQLAPDIQVLNQFVTHDINILMVGRVAPNKGHASLIEALATYRREYNRYARLLIVGKEAVQLASYSLSLRQLAANLAIDNAVIFTGAVTDAQLKAYYLAADFFMLTSHHEGFCVPLVEAMAMKVPIITCDSSAIPATVGKAGLVWKDRNPYLLAESIDYLDQNEALSVELGLMGRKRYEEFFSNERIAEAFIGALTQGGVL
ncbi:MAG TPA: glycosyltransferase family 4 protein [Pyrinomonadaceae bacterium]